MIVLDLSKLSSLLNTLSYWLSVIRKIFPDDSRTTAKEGSLKFIQDNIWSMHEDYKYMNPISLPIVVIANKYDIFIKEDP